MLPALTARVFLDCLPLAGLSPVALLQDRFGSREPITRSSQLAVRDLAALFETIGEQAPPSFAGLCGRNVSTPHLGVLGHALVNCRDMHEFFTCMEMFSVVSGHPFAGRVTRTQTHWSFEMTPRVPLGPRGLRLCGEATVIGFVRFAREIADIRRLLSGIEVPWLEDEASEDLDLPEGMLRFNSRSLRFRGPIDSLATRLAGADPEVYEVCIARCRQRLAAVNRSLAVEQRVEMAVVTSPRIPAAADVARQLGIGARSLFRALANEGTTFQSIVDRCRRDRLEGALRSGRYSQKELAWMLGFADASCMRRKFRDWTGGTISQWRSGQVAAALG
jgi:AraC-like DNA-binding protein